MKTPSLCQAPSSLLSPWSCLGDVCKGKGLIVCVLWFPIRACFLLFDKILISEHFYYYMRCEGKGWESYNFVVFGKNRGESWRRLGQAGRRGAMLWLAPVCLVSRLWLLCFDDDCWKMHVENPFIFFFCLVACFALYAYVAFVDSEMMITDMLAC